MTEAGRAWWRRVWRSPVSGGWTEADVPAVQRLARILSALSVEGETFSAARREVRALGEACDLELDALDKLLTRYAGMEPSLLAEARQLEDRLGLSPRARRSLGWSVADPSADGGRGKAAPAAAHPAVDGRILKALEGGRS